jgi:thiosulfate dehydrogenase
MWAAYVDYPEYRKKDNLVNTPSFVSRAVSASARTDAPGGRRQSPDRPGEPFLLMAAGLPVGIKPKVASYPPLAEPSQPQQRGAKVYAANCVLCHGEDARRAAGGQQVFPPLGDRNPNWGAGMHQLTSPPRSSSTTCRWAPRDAYDQEADVAAYMNSHAPAGSASRRTETTRKLYHSGHEHDFYGREVDGLVLGAPGIDPK